VCIRFSSNYDREAEAVKERHGTSDEEAFAMAHEGATLLDRYRVSQDRSLLVMAERHLQRAVARDPGFPFAVFTHGVALEYLGDHKGAIESFTRLAERYPDYQAEDVVYNLATSELCTYKPEGYRSAATRFTSLADRTRSAEMKALAHASLAMTYSQMLPAIYGGQDVSEIAKYELLVARHAETAERLASGARQDDWRVVEAHWLSHNAVGFTRMYQGQYVGKGGGQTTIATAHFDTADSEFEAALRYSPANPDVQSNRGTLWLMRWRIDRRAESLERSRELWLNMALLRISRSTGWAKSKGV
jgi:tetratricopeptide (TPR) repeat protein